MSGGITMRWSHLFLVAASLGVCASARAQTCSDATRTVEARGAAACRVYDGDPTTCAKAWALTQNGTEAVSCFYVPAQSACQGCGPNNQASGLCVNTCASPPPLPVDALPALARGGLAAALAAASFWGARRRTRAAS